MRISSASLRRIAAQPLIAVVLVVSIGEGAMLLRPAQPVVAEKAVPVSSTRLVCSSSPTSTAGSDLAVVAAPVDGVLPATGDTVTARPLLPPLDEESGDGQEPIVVPVVPEPLIGIGGGSVSTSPAGALPVLVEGVGSLAATTAASLTSIAARGDDRGWAAQSCEAAATSWWFVGGASTLGRLTRIVVTNPDLAPATFDIHVFGPRGAIDAPAGRGLTVAPTSRVEVRLDALAPDVAVAALHVTATTGRVHAGVLVRGVDALVPLGSEWLPPLPTQSRALIPVPAGLRSLELSLMSIDPAQTRISVQVHTGSGSFVPVGLDELAPGAGMVVSVPMDDALVDGGVVEISASTRIVATVLARLGDAGLGDVVAFGSAPSIVGLSVVAGLRPGAAHVLTLSGVSAAGTAQVVRIGPDGDAQSSEIAFSAVTPVQVDLAALGTTGSTTLVVRSATPFIATVLSAGRDGQGVLASARTLTRRPTSVTRPDARMAIAMGTRGDTSIARAR